MQIPSAVMQIPSAVMQIPSAVVRLMGFKRRANYVDTQVDIDPQIDDRFSAAHFEYVDTQVDDTLNM